MPENKDAEIKDMIGKYLTQNKDEIKNGIRIMYNAACQSPSPDVVGDYWKRRCEAAEKYIEAMWNAGVSDTFYGLKDAHDKWQDIIREMDNQ